MRPGIKCFVVTAEQRQNCLAVCLKVESVASTDILEAKKAPGLVFDLFERAVASAALLSCDGAVGIHDLEGVEALCRHLSSRGVGMSFFVGLCLHL